MTERAVTPEDLARREAIILSDEAFILNRKLAIKFERRKENGHLRSRIFTVSPTEQKARVLGELSGPVRRFLGSGFETATFRIHDSGELPTIFTDFYDVKLVHVVTSAGHGILLTFDAVPNSRQIVKGKSTRELGNSIMHQ